MTAEQIVLFSLVILIFAFLLWGRFRYDVVAFAALVIAFSTGAIPSEDVFSGFGHPAVVIVVLVLIVSRGLSRSGAIGLLAQKLLDVSRGVQGHIGVMAGISAALSSVMNNVAALALLMPMDMLEARRAKRSPAVTLMPLSFASILGGMVTLIGTPPNIVIATFREDVLGESYRMFDFAPVGIVVAIVGVLYIVFLGWRLIPVERRKHDTAKELKELKDYVAEAQVPKSSATIGKTVRELDGPMREYDVEVLGLVRRGRRLPGSSRNERVRSGDVVVLEGVPEAIDQFVAAANLVFTGSEKHKGIASEALELTEVVVPEGARIVGRSAFDVRLLYRQGVTLLGISRRGRRIRERVRKTNIRAGDMLLLLGPEDHLHDVIEWLGCLPIAGSTVELGNRRKAWAAVGVFAAAIVKCQPRLDLSARSIRCRGAGLRPAPDRSARPSL